MVNRFGRAAQMRVFISYARDDTYTVGKLCEVLQAAGADVVIDKDLLTPVTRKWEKKIRKSIAKVNYVIYVATKEAADSVYVEGELEVAREFNVQVISFWIRGDLWANCAPLHLLGGQRIDARREGFSRGVDELILWLGLSQQPGADDHVYEESDAAQAQGPQANQSNQHRFNFSQMLTPTQINASLADIEELQRQGRIHEAIQIGEELLLQGVHRADLNYALGLLYEAAERWFHASTLFLASRWDTRYAVTSCYELGRCANAFGDPEGAAEFFNQAINQMDFEALIERDVDQVINICDAAAHASRIVGDNEVADRIYDDLISYLNTRKWDEARRRAETLRVRFKKKWPPAMERRHISESRPFEEQIPQRIIDPLEYFTTPPNEGGAANLSNAARSGVRQTTVQMPIARVQAPGPVTGTNTDAELTSGVTQPVPIVRITQEMVAVKPAANADYSVRPTDLLDAARDSIFGPEGNLHTVLEQMMPTTRGNVARMMRSINDLLKSGQLTQASVECVSVLGIAKGYFSVYALLGEIFLRLGHIADATQQYVELAEQCLKQGHIEDAIATYTRILQLDPDNAAHRNRLYTLQTQLELKPNSDPATVITANELSPDKSLTFLMPTQNDVGRESAGHASPMAQTSDGADRVATVARDSAHKATISTAGPALSASSLIDHDVLPEWMRSPQGTEAQGVEAQTPLRSKHDDDNRTTTGQPEQANALLQKARLVTRYEASNQIEEAISVLREMAQEASNDVTIQSRLAKNLISQGYVDDGAAVLAQLAALYEARDEMADAAQVFQRLAEIAWSRRDQDGTLKWQRLAICCAAEDVPQRQKLVKYCIEMGRSAEAIEQQTYISRYYFLNQQWHKAVVTLNQWIMLDKQSVEAHDLLGQTYLKLAEDRKAERVYRKLARVAPGNPLVRTRLRELAASRTSGPAVAAQ